jgi:hypothetical protein
MIPNRKKADVFGDVAKFTELAQPDMLVPEGQAPHPKAIELAIKLIDEECNSEYIPALRKLLANRSRENLLEVLDGAIDSIYVIAWALRILNLPAHAAWNEVQRSNMAKFPLSDYGEKDTFAVSKLDPAIDIDVNVRDRRLVLTNHETGKVVKPAGWTPPDLFGVIMAIESMRSNAYSA